MLYYFFAVTRHYETKEFIEEFILTYGSRVRVHDGRKTWQIEVTSHFQLQAKSRESELEVGQRGYKLSKPVPETYFLQQISTY